MPATDEQLGKFFGRLRTTLAGMMKHYINNHSRPIRKPDVPHLADSMLRAAMAAAEEVGIESVHVAGCSANLESGHHGRYLTQRDWERELEWAVALLLEQPFMKQEMAWQMNEDEHQRFQSILGRVRAKQVAVHGNPAA